MSPSLLLVVAAIAAVVIFSGRASAVMEWVSQFTNGGKAQGELALIANLVEAAKSIQDAEQKAKVRDACTACFTGWLKTQLPE